MVKKLVFCLILVLFALPLSAQQIPFGGTEQGITGMTEPASSYTTPKQFQYYSVVNKAC